MNPNDLKRVKQTLKRLTFIMQQLNEGVAVTDLNSKILFANAAMARMHGFESCRELTATSITRFYSNDQIQTVLKSMIDTVQNCGNVQQSITHTRKDGSTFSALTKMVLLKNEQGRTIGLIMLVTDLSSWKQQQSLTQHIEQFESTNNQLIQQVRDLRQTLEHNLEEQMSFDPNEQFGPPLSVRRDKVAAKRHLRQNQPSDAPTVTDGPSFLKEHFAELAYPAKKLKR